MVLEKLRRMMGRDQRAGAAMEFALLLPLLLLILLGAIDFGRFAYTGISINNAARTGAGMCAYGPCTPTVNQIKQVVVDEAKPYLTISLSNISVDKNVTAAPGCSSARPCLRIDVTHPFSTLIPWPGIPTSLTLARSAQVVTAIQ